MVLNQCVTEPSYEANADAGTIAWGIDDYPYFLRGRIRGARPNQPRAGGISELGVGLVLGCDSQAWLVSGCKYNSAKLNSIQLERWRLFL